jgi:uncharacterized protein YjiS (DUF1127 family)
MSATASNMVRPARGKAPGTSAQLLSAFWNGIAGYFVRRAAIATLRELDNRALRDIGLARTQIEAAVHGRITPSEQERMS